MLMAALLSGCTDKVIVLDPKGPIGEAQKDLIYLSTILCLIVIVPVLLLTAWVVWRYRDKPGRKAAYKPEWEHNTKLEIIWWTIPILIIIALGTVTVKYTYALEPSKPIESEKEPVTIQVTSLDWKWLFKYPDEGIATVNYVNIPEDVPIRFQLTSETAMNSFWIPQLGGQIYTMSGMAMTLYLQADEPGTYYGSGANFTGEHFAKMTFDVNAMPQEEYDEWVKQAKASGNPLTEEGYEQLKIPGTTGTHTFSSFPKGLFEKVVNQYAVGGSAHRHHGAAPGGESESRKEDAGAKGEHAHTPAASPSPSGGSHHAGH
ncbi:ubiquinol oxidase subunit II [Paenibacillus thermoaerophilus]|uniref:Quinol oxidase subunit 2 n=1 Tax=Paenibacillus thermoaerophilus TaxID=1215385 RepID=A0ABW2V3M1_9BACL|nr:ubiquinol oxidase subunit II [Paenibacillus thermoaerophilus]TMV17515.1 ubiquinol oxidase subunit II [Paenibacillus thermoaerophilus]